MKKTRLMPKMSRTISTEDVVILSKRRSGNTTRIIDKVIQDLCDRKLCQVVDHSVNGGNDLWRRVIERLRIEHPSLYTYLCVNEEESLMWLSIMPVSHERRS